MQTKAFSIFSTKSIEEDNTHFIINGIASTPSLDSDLDSIKSTGASFRTLPFPFLLNHDTKQPVGSVTKATPTSNGIEVEIKIPYVKEEGKLKEQTEYAIHAIKYQVINGLSIGFSASHDDVTTNKSGGYNIDKFEVHELSLTALQSNMNAFVTSFKSLSTLSTDTDDTEQSIEPTDTEEVTDNTAISEEVTEDVPATTTEAVSDEESITTADSSTSDIVTDSKTISVTEAITVPVKLTQNKNITNTVKLN